MNLHPGVAPVLKKLGMDELDVAKAIRDGEMTSPQRYENVSLVDMRVTGTGTAYRKALDEFVYRPPELYLTDRFLERVAGLPVVIEHPPGDKLTSDEYADRVVGSVYLPYVKGDEVWAVAKIHDDAARKMFEEDRLSTSPAVLFRDPSVNEKVELDDGRTLLIEGKPSLLDHLAICEKGVWDKGGEPTGVAMAYGDSAMTDDEKRAAEEKARMDAEAGEKLDRLLSHMDSLTKRMDAYEAAAAKKDAPEGESEEERVKKAAEAAEAERLDREKADAARRDAKPEGEETKPEAKAESEEDRMAREDAARRDAEEKAELKRRMDALESMAAGPAPEEEAAMADAQARCDSVAVLHGSRAPRALRGESLLAYRKRMAKDFQRHSNAWKGIDLNALPKPAFDVAESQIYADAQKAAESPEGLVGALREVRRADPTGRMISTFYGDPEACWAPFKAVKRRLAGINKGA